MYVHSGSVPQEGTDAVRAGASRLIGSGGAPGRSVELETALDAAPVGRFLLGMLALCACVALLDGFDTLAITYVAPVIAKAWQLPKEAFGPIFAAHYVGAAAGAAIFGILADRWGRRPAIVWSTAVFAAFALATPLAQDFGSLFVLRALTGVGLGGALSNVIALVSEFAPARSRATMVSVLYAAFPLGGVFGGPLSAYLLEHHSWQAVFVVGGLLPLALLPLLIRYLPESVRFLLTRNPHDSQVARQMSKLDALAGYTSSDIFTAPRQADSRRTPISKVFGPGLLMSSVLLGAAAFATQILIVYIITWMPTLLQATGIPLSHAILTSAAFSLGGIAGSLLLAATIDKRRSYAPLVATFLAAALAIAAIGFAPGDRMVLTTVVALAGGLIVGAQVNLSSYSATVYPTEVRATGVGWVVGIGRVGAIAGALVGSLFLALNLSLAWQYVLVGSVSLVIALLVQLARSSKEAN